MPKPFATVRRSAVALLAAGLALGLAACSSTSSSTAPAEEETTASTELIPITVGVTPTSLSTAQYAALNEGIFEDAGFDVEFHVQASLAESMPLLLAGDIQYVWADTHNAILARTEGMPLVIAATTIVSPSTAPERGSLNFIVPEGSDVKAITDFGGKTLAVSALGGQAHLDVQTVLEREGVDVSTVEFIAIPPPQMEAAVRQGQVDIAALVEPLGTGAVLAGGVEMVGQTDDALPNAPMFVLAATEEYVEANFDEVQRFQEAIYEAGELVNNDRDLANTTIATFMELPAEVIEASGIAKMGVQPASEADLRLVADRLVTFDVITSDQAEVVTEMLPLN